MWDKHQYDCQRNLYCTVGTVSLRPPWLSVCSFFYDQKNDSMTLPNPSSWQSDLYLLLMSEFGRFPPNCINTFRQPPLFSWVRAGMVTKPTAFSLNQGIDMTRMYPRRVRSSQYIRFLLISTTTRDMRCLLCLISLSLSLSVVPYIFFIFFKDSDHPNYKKHQKLNIPWSKYYATKQTSSTEGNRQMWFKSVVKTTK